jgi:hypothetical protein
MSRIDRYGRRVESNPLRVTLLVLGLAIVVGAALGTCAGDRLVDHIMGENVRRWE